MNLRNVLSHSPPSLLWSVFPVMPKDSLLRHVKTNKAIDVLLAEQLPRIFIDMSRSRISCQRRSQETLSMVEAGTEFGQPSKWSLKTCPQSASPNCPLYL